MQNEIASPWAILQPNLHLIVISIFGGLVLFCLKFTEHFQRSEQDKMPTKKYLIFFIGLSIGLPLLGAGVTSIYIMNGDKLSPILALQVGLTSPAIVQSLIIAAANSLAKNSAPAIAAGQ